MSKMRSVFCIFFALLLVFSAAQYSSPPTESKSKECPEGYVLKGKTCEAVVVKEPQYVCPRGTTSVDGECLTFVPLKFNCPPGFSLSAKQCTQIQTSPVQHYCNEGELQGSSCVLELPQAPVCPTGYMMDEDHCVRFAPALKKCPQGYSMHGKECTKRVSFPASPTCPEGTQLSNSGSKCSRFEERPPYCPSGYQIDRAGQCAKFVGKVSSPCPPGYKATGNICETTEQAPAEVLCPSDMQLDIETESCVKELPVPSKCPPGYSPAPSAQGFCERLLPSRPVCPPDTAPAGAGECKRRIVTAKYPKCPKGFELIGEKCKKVEEFPTRVVCKVGRLEGDQCVTQETVSPQYACPDDYELSKSSKGPQCSRVVQYDCSTTVMQKECEMPEFVQQLTPQRKLKEYAPTVRPTPVTQHGKQPVCRQVPVQVPRTCTRQESAPVKYVCADGGALVGKDCRVQQLSPAMTICTAGDMDAASGRCLKISVVPATWHCASGSDAGGMTCVEYERVPADYVCPSGTEAVSDYEGRTAHKCAERKAEIAFPNKIMKQKPKLVCNVGVLKGRVCVETVRTPRGYECPAGSADLSESGSLKCAVLAEIISPPAVEVATPPKYVCPDGTSASAKLCYTTESEAVDEYCPHGMAFNEGKCVTAVEVVVPAPVIKKTPALRSCPEGYSLQGNSCRSVQQLGATPSCPEGYEEFIHRGKETCAQSHSMQAVCPPGTLQSPQGCSSKKHAPPRVTIVRTCTKGQPGC